MRIGGAMLVVVGILLVTGWWDWAVQWLQYASSAASRSVVYGRHREAPRGRAPSGELGTRELARWLWRQIVSMRTALVLLLFLALAAVPGSVIPQSGVDALEVSRWKAAHPDLTPVYERLGLFSVYDSVWFSAIYLLLMLSLVGCIIPRSFVYLRALRAKPPAAPRNLTRLPDHATYETGARSPTCWRGRGRCSTSGATGCAPTTTCPVRSAPRRATCASSATWSSTSR